MQVTVRKVVEVKASADDWGLYDTVEREDVAWNLNEEFMSLVHTGRDRSQVESIMTKHLEHYAKDGAADTEGRNTLEYLLDQVFSIDHIL